MMVEMVVRVVMVVIMMVMVIVMMVTMMMYSYICGQQMGLVMMMTITLTNSDDVSIKVGQVKLVWSCW